MVTRLKCLVLAAMLAACLPADGKPVATPPPADVGPDMTVYFGDSLCWDATDELTVLYVADPGRRASINCFGGTQLDTPAWVEKYGFVDDLPSQPGAVVVIALGTNDIGLDANLDITKLQLVDAVTRATNAQASVVVVPNLSTTALTGPRLAKTQQWNTWLWQADDHPGLPTLRVTDFQSCSAGHLDWFKPGDAIHHSLAGQAAYAQFLYEGSC